MMGRLETTIETKVSRQAHLEPDTAPSAVPYSIYVRYVASDKCVCFCRGIVSLHGTYPHNCSGPNNTCYHDKGGTGKKNHERDFSFQVEVNSPEKGERD